MRTNSTIGFVFSTRANTTGVARSNEPLGSFLQTAPDGFVAQKRESTQIWVRKNAFSSPFALTWRSSSFLRQFLLEFTGKFLHVRGFTKRLNLSFGRIDVYAHMLAEFLEHLKDGC